MLHDDICNTMIIQARNCLIQQIVPAKIEKRNIPIFNLIIFSSACGESERGGGDTVADGDVAKGYGGTTEVGDEG